MACSKVNVMQGNLTLNRVLLELSFCSQDREFFVLSRVSDLHKEDSIVWNCLVGWLVH